MNNAIEITNLTKSYSGFKLNHVNLKVEKGSIMGLVGENGAGKTTMIKLMLNSAKREEGDIRLLGMDLLEHEKQIKEEVGVVLDGCFFPENLKVGSIEQIMRCFYKNWDKPLFLQYCQKFALPLDKPIKNFSKGMRMKLAIVCALSHHPKLLILDEPTSGLDPIVRSEILEIFRDFIQDEEHSILISSHITSDLEHIADYITFIDQGEIVLSETYENLTNSYGIVRCDENIFKKMEKDEILRYRKNRYSYDVLVNDSDKMAKKYPGITIDRSSIEDIMILYIKGEKR